MAQNHVVIFSNGIADFQRAYIVRKGAPTEISIPVKTHHVADVLASLNAYGAVALKSPPSFRPSNESAGSLNIDPQRVVEGLATTLSGSKIEIQRASGVVSGRLVGLHSEPEATAGEPIERRFLVVLTAEGFQKVPLAELQKLRFQDQAVQTEIEKALQRNFQQIKPGSTFVELALTTDVEETQATVQYTVPAAAWKISYRLRQQEDGRFGFQGFAIVDNNTDEDWNDFLVSVVTGEPITFSTDLAESKTPRRSHVNVVREAALGAVEVEEALPEALVAGGGAPQVAIAAAPAGRAMDKRRRREFARATEPVERMAKLAPSAEVEAAERREVGDFCVFSAASPVSIASNRSAAIPVFQAALEQSKTVLHYKKENHAERPYRAIEFKNETPHSLGRGICTVYEQGTYAGSCIVPALKPGGDALLPHALETGVRVRHEPKRPQRRLVRLRLADGYCFSSYHVAQRTVYRVENQRDEPYALVVDHDYTLEEPKVECTLARAGAADAPLAVTETLKEGIRLRLMLGSREQFALTVIESRVEESRVVLVNVTPKVEQYFTAWLEENLIATNGPLAKHPGVLKCLEIQRLLDAKGAEIAAAVAETQRLAERQDRLRKNIAATGQDEQSARWKAELGQAEDKLVDLEENRIPKLRDEERQIKADLRRALERLAADWSAD